MIEITGDIWRGNFTYRIIPTNGSVNRYGKAVMGRGLAFQVTKKFPMFASFLGYQLEMNGNKVFVFDNFRLITFPVKHKWFNKASLLLIDDSVSQLIKLIDPTKEYVMPRVGCGNGGLDWNQVKPVLSRLPDNVKVISL